MTQKDQAQTYPPNPVPCRGGWICRSVRADFVGPMHCVGFGKTPEEAIRLWAAVFTSKPLFLQDTPGPHRKSMVELYTMGTIGKAH